MLSTKSVGLDPETANPKPVTGFDYAGQPMKPNSFYNGRPEHMDPDAQVQAEKASVVRVQRKVKRSWTATQLQAMRERMANARAVAKARRETNPNP
jgi:hypothetical protein